MVGGLLLELVRHLPGEVQEALGGSGNASGASGIFGFVGHQRYLLPVSWEGPWHRWTTTTFPTDR
jgi:hypothetical protein